MKQFSFSKDSCVFWFSQFKCILFLGLLNSNILSSFILYLLKFTRFKLLKFKGRRPNLPRLHIWRHLRYLFNGRQCNHFNFASHNILALLVGSDFFGGLLLVGLIELWCLTTPVVWRGFNGIFSITSPVFIFLLSFLGRFISLVSPLLSLLIHIRHRHHLIPWIKVPLVVNSWWWHHVHRLTVVVGRIGIWVTVISLLLIVAHHLLRIHLSIEAVYWCTTLVSVCRFKVVHIRHITRNICRRIVDILCWGHPAAHIIRRRGCLSLHMCHLLRHWLLDLISTFYLLVVSEPHVNCHVILGIIAHWWHTLVWPWNLLHIFILLWRCNLSRHSGLLLALHLVTFIELSNHLISEVRVVWVWPLIQIVFILHIYNMKINYNYNNNWRI